jgi:hypothetical protein
MKNCIGTLTSPLKRSPSLLSRAERAVRKRPTCDWSVPKYESWRKNPPRSPAHRL